MVPKVTRMEADYGSDRRAVHSLPRTSLGRLALALLAAFAVGFRRERSVLAFVSVFIGLLVLVFWIAEIVSEHQTSPPQAAMGV